MHQKLVEPVSRIVPDGSERVNSKVYKGGTVAGKLGNFLLENIFSTLDMIVKLLYYFGMVTKKDQIQTLVDKWRRVSTKYSRVEDHQIPLHHGAVLTTKEVHTIQAVGEKGPLNVTELAAYLGITKSAASQMVMKLTQRGFLKKTISEHSNKEYVLSLKKSGKEAFEIHQQLHGKDKQAIVTALGRFSIPQIRAMSDMFEVLEDVLNKRLET